MPNRYSDDKVGFIWIMLNIIASESLDVVVICDLHP